MLGVVTAAAALGAVVVLLIVLVHPEKETYSLTIATATRGGTYHPLGTQLAGILRELPDRPIEEARAITSAGSDANIDLLLSGKAQLAFIQSTALAKRRGLAPTDIAELRAIASLYLGIIQVVVRDQPVDPIRNLEDLRDKRIYVGRKGSGTHQIAIEVLGSAGVDTVANPRLESELSYEEAFRKLVHDPPQLDAAVFASGTPTEVAKKAMSTGKCRLLSVPDPDNRIKKALPGLISAAIPASFYEGQSQRITTLGVRAVLVARHDMPDDLAFVVVDALFDNLQELFLAHSKAQDISFTDAWAAIGEDVAPDELMDGLRFHPGALRFREGEQDKVLIATGALGGYYYHLGKRIQAVLAQHRIPARTGHTEGSIENAELLQKMEQPTIAIMQYDMALKLLWETPRRSADACPLPHLSRLRRLASLHEEKLHIVARTSILSDRHADRATVTSLCGLKDRLSVCLGPLKSGSAQLARAVMESHGLGERWGNADYKMLSVRDMVTRLHSGEIDVGAFTSRVPCEVMKTVLADPRFRLISVDPSRIAPMTGGAVWMSTIMPGTYGCQLDHSRVIDTVATRAVIVTTENPAVEAGEMTRALFEGVGHLGVEGGTDTLKEDLPSLKLHPSAAIYYRKAGYLPSPPRFRWLAPTYTTLAILVILIGAYNGLSTLRRDRTTDRIARQIFHVSVSAGEESSVQKLLAIREQIGERVGHHRWRFGEIDRSRWKTLAELIDLRITEAKENLLQSLVSEIGTIRGEADISDDSRRYRMSQIAERSWKHLENGELSKDQYDLLTKLMVSSAHPQVST
jgi:TRAP transporter TAXI family solute receptor